MREREAKREANLQYILTEKQVADRLIQALLKDKFIAFRDVLGLKIHKY